MEYLNFGRITSENQLVFLNTGKLVGIQSISINNDLGAEPLNYIGVGSKRIYQVPTKQQVSTVGIASLLINQDSFFNLTGNQPINIFILQNQNNLTNGYSLISGYMNSYSARYSFGQASEIQTTFSFYRNAGQIKTTELDPISSGQLIGISNNNYAHNNEYLIPDGQSVNLTMDEVNTNRVNEFSVSLAIKREPIYNVGKRFPVSIKTIYPIEVSCSVSFDAPKNYSGIKLTEFPQSPKTQNISLQLNNYNTSEIIASYNFSNMTMTNEDYAASADNNVIVNRSYIGFING